MMCKAIKLLEPDLNDKTGGSAIILNSLTSSNTPFPEFF